jgi:hypothetical protein
MMRWTLVLTCGLLLLWLTALRASEQAKGPPAPLQQPGLVPREVRGVGHTQEEAKRNAQRQAVLEVASFLQRQEPPLTGWQPDEVYIQKHLIDPSGGRPGEDIRLRDLVRQDDDPVPDEVRKVWIATFRDSNWAALLQEARSHQNESFAGFLLLGVCVFLGAGLGYTRLVDWLHESYTNWLLVGGVAVALLALASVALYIA